MKTKAKIVWTAEDLHRHLEKDHNLSPFSTYLKEIVYGGTDGIVTTFAVVAGFAGAQNSTLGDVPLFTVLLFGTANLFADGASMALGNFLSIRADQDVYASEKAVEAKEIKYAKKEELAETVAILKIKGYTPKDAEKFAELLAKNPSYWAEFMMQDELEMENPERDNPFFSAIATFFSFIVFGTIPLLPYLLQISNQNFMSSILFTFMALLLLGFMRFKVTKIKLMRALSEVVLLGGIAAFVAYFVGTFFRT